jgi:nicotinamide mononucleotide transporter
MVNSIINKFGKYLGVEGTFASWFVTIGIITQLLTYYIMNDSALAVCSGIAGVISVVLCSQRKYAFYFWGVLQLVTIMIISYQTGLYGKLVENAFYLITMFVGMEIWKKNTTDDKTQVRTMDLTDYVIFGCLFLPFAIILAYSIVNQYNTDQIVLDIITTVIGIVAQIMLILRFREQWVLWFILDVLCVVLWALDSNWCLMTQYIFWSINCIYGFFYWRYAKN